jgi:hypothetical protein
MFAEAGFACVPSTGSWADQVAAAEGAVDAHRPDIAVVATSMKAGVDAALVRASRSAGVPTICILDAWVNYRERFMGPGDSTVLAAGVPDLITVMDNFTVDEMTALGFSRETLEVVGQPAFDGWIERSSSAAWEKKRGEARDELDMGDSEALVVFFSQALDVDYGPPGSPRYRGYDQRQAFEALQGVVASLDPRARLVVKPHPRERVDAYEHVEAGGTRAPRVVPSMSPDLLTAGADVVVSMTSITLVQSMLTGTPTISFQPGLVADDANVLGRMGIMPPITEVEALPDAIRGALARGSQDVRAQLPSEWIDGRATERAVTAVERVMKGL